MKLYNFIGGSFDNFLDEFIGNTRAGKEWNQIRRDVELVHQPDASWTTVKSESNGLFIQRAENSPKIRVFLYLRKYNVVQYGGLPKKHYFECEIVSTYSNFSISNDDSVDIYCRDTGYKYQDKSLDICKKCQDIFKEKTSQALFGKSHDDFILQWASLNIPTQTDLNGYPINFAEISTAFRRKKNYTCEGCGLKIINQGHRKYMHTHHRNKDKVDNSTKNLACLCIRCHANVDDLHRRNFQENSAMQRELKNFNTLYPI